MTTRIGERRRLVVDWSADGDGECTGTTARVLGVLASVRLIPGDPVPDDNYVVTLTDEHGIDLLSGQGAAVDADNEVVVMPGISVTDGTTLGVIPRVVSTPITISVSGAGSEGAGTIVILMDEP